MIPDFLLAGFTAIWLGIMTSVSPCPLATNIAAISYVSKKVDVPEKVFRHGLMYVFGRTLTYAGIGIVLVGSLIPVAVRHGSGVILPSLYGIATGLPVAVFALLIAFGAQKVAQAYNTLAGFD